MKVDFFLVYCHILLTHRIPVWIFVSDCPTSRCKVYVLFVIKVQLIQLHSCLGIIKISESWLSLQVKSEKESRLWSYTSKHPHLLETEVW